MALRRPRWGLLPSFQLRISPLRIKPPVWRQIQAPTTILLCCLRHAIQAVMGWTDQLSHERPRSVAHRSQSLTAGTRGRLSRKRAFIGRVSGQVYLDTSRVENTRISIQRSRRGFLDNLSGWYSQASVLASAAENSSITDTRLVVTQSKCPLRIRFMVDPFA